MAPLSSGAKLVNNVRLVRTNVLSSALFHQAADMPAKASAAVFRAHSCQRSMRRPAPIGEVVPLRASA
jgi:hypothetical protein